MLWQDEKDELYEAAEIHIRNSPTVLPDLPARNHPYASTKCGACGEYTRRWVMVRGRNYGACCYDKLTKKHKTYHRVAR